MVPAWSGSRRRLRWLPRGPARLRSPSTPCAPRCSDSERDARSINDAGVQFKFLVPSSVVGAVLGRGGATVAAIKRETGAYVQVRGHMQRRSCCGQQAAAINELPLRV